MLFSESRTHEKFPAFHKGPYARIISQAKLAPGDLGTEHNHLYICSLPTVIIFLFQQLNKHRIDGAYSDLETMAKVVANGECVYVCAKR